MKRTENGQAAIAAVTPRRQAGGVMVWLLGLIVLTGAAVIGALIAYFIFTYVEVKLPLHDQPATVTLPDPLTGRAEVLEKLDIAIDDTIQTQVPVNQQVTIPIKDTLDLKLHFDGDVPLKLDIPVNETIQLKQKVDLDTVIKARILGDTQKLPVQGTIPINEKVPLDLTVPVDKTVHLNFTAPVSAEIDQELTVPLKTTIDANVPIDSAFNVPVLNQLKGRIDMPDTPTKVVINKADLKLPLRTLELSMKNDEDTGGNGRRTAQ